MGGLQLAWWGRWCRWQPAGRRRCAEASALQITALNPWLAVDPAVHVPSGQTHPPVHQPAAEGAQGQRAARHMAAHPPAPRALSMGRSRQAVALQACTSSYEPLSPPLLCNPQANSPEVQAAMLRAFGGLPYEQRHFLEALACGTPPPQLLRLQGPQREGASIDAAGGEGLRRGRQCLRSREGGTPG